MFVFWYRMRVNFKKNMSQTALVHFDMILLRSMPFVVILAAFYFPDICQLKGLNLDVSLNVVSRSVTK